MSEVKSNIDIKLSPAMTAVAVVILLIAGGVVYMTKPAWFEAIVSQASSGEFLTQSRYYPEIEENLKVYLHSAVIRNLAEIGAPQAEFDAVGTVEIENISASTIGYYRREMDFWQKRDLRSVDLLINFTCGGKAYAAEGSMTVSGLGNHISLLDVALIK